MILLLCMVLIAFLISVIGTLFIRRFAFKYEICAKQNRRSVHTGYIPLLGGVAIYIAFGISILIFLLSSTLKYLLLALSYSNHLYFRNSVFLPAMPWLYAATVSFRFWRFLHPGLGNATPAKTGGISWVCRVLFMRVSCAAFRTSC